MQRVNLDMKTRFLSLLFSLGMVSFIMACPNSRALIDAQIQTKRTRLQERAKVFAHVCYREGASLENGTTLLDRQAYYAQLLKDILETSQTDYSNQDVERLKQDFLERQERFSTEKILECASRNFQFISEMDKAWFKIFDRYGIEAHHVAQGLVPMMEQFLRSDVIAVGNNHSLAVEQGKLLFELTDFLESLGKRVEGLYVEFTDLREGMFQTWISQVRRVQAQRKLSTPDSIEEVVDLEISKIMFQNKNQNSSFDEKEFRFIHIPRLKTYLKYALGYPEIELLPSDGRQSKKEGPSNYIAMNSEMVLSRISRNSDSYWLSFFGEHHTGRFQGSDTERLEELGARLFVISQYGGSRHLEIMRGIEINDPSVAFTAAVSLFNFPTHMDLPLRLETAGDFGFYWPQLKEKYNAWKRPHALPIYVNLRAAEENGLLEFFNDQVYADLVIIPPPHHSPFQFETDTAYQYLKKALEAL